MLILNNNDLEGIKKISEIVALTLKQMQQYACTGMSTLELDNYGGQILSSYGARSAPRLVYNFPGYSCISINNEICHGIPSSRIIQEGDLLNIDVSAELNGYWSDNGASMIVGKDIHVQKSLIDASKEILQKAIHNISAGVKISEIGALIEQEAKRRGYKVIKNLAGHGVGGALHEEPDNILNYKDRYDHRRFRKNSVIAIETFINTHSTLAVEAGDSFTLVGNKGGFAAQHEHTILVTDATPIILTSANGI